MDRSRFEPRRAFTLIELLATIATAAILAALLLPCLSGVKASAVSAKCKSNLRQIGLAITMYVQDEHTYPPRYSSGLIPNGRIGASWDSLLRPFVSNEREVFLCPASQTSFQWTNTARPNFCYGYNAYGTAIPGGSAIALGLDGDVIQNETHGLPEGRVKVASDMIAAGDYQTRGDQDGDISPSSFEPDDWLSDRHNHGANAVFCDVHVEYGKQKAWVAATDSARKRWNNDNQPHPETWY